MPRLALFGRSKISEPARENNSKDQITEWQRRLRGEIRTLQREIQKISNEEQKVRAEVKKAAGRKDATSTRILAKEIVRSRRARERLLFSKAQLNSICHSLTQSRATLNITGTLQKNTDIMSSMSAVQNISQVSDTMKQFSREMIKMGLIDDQVYNALELGGDEDEADMEVDQISEELAIDAVEGLPGARHLVSVEDTMHVPSSKGVKVGLEDINQ